MGIGGFANRGAAAETVMSDRVGKGIADAAEL
jgi:hypothetical protein